jgi:prepilin-type N-terminal cleavage/methylation domain-containing protein
MNNFFRHIDFEKRRMPSKNGLTLIELLVVIGIIAAVVAISLPAINAMQKSFDSTGAEGMINAALSTARTLAITRQQYVGVRFQKEYDVNDVLNANQYMIFVIYKESKEMGNLGDAFHAIDGYKPMKLPANIGVMDMKLGSTNQIVDSDDRINDDWEVADTTTFSIIFSQSGKLVIHNAQVRNKNGIPDSPGEINNPSVDNVFNKKDEVDKGIGMFYQDDYASQNSQLRYCSLNFGFGKEASRKEFIIYNTQTFNKLNANERYEKYLKDLPVLYINPYTGGIIE